MQQRVAPRLLTPNGLYFKVPISFPEPASLINTVPSDRMLTLQPTIQRSADGTSRRLFGTHFNFVTPDLSGRSRPARDSKLVELF